MGRSNEYFASDSPITDRVKIMHAAVTSGAPTYLYHRPTLVRWELMGLVYVDARFDDWDRYRATEAGKNAFARLALP